MTKKISKPTTDATVTPTVDPKSIARCGIPAPLQKDATMSSLNLLMM